VKRAKRKRNVLCERIYERKKYKIQPSSHRKVVNYAAHLKKIRTDFVNLAKRDTHRRRIKNVCSNFILKDKKFNFAPKIGWRALAEGEPATSFSDWRRVQDSNLQGFSPTGFQDQRLTVRPTLPHPHLFIRHRATRIEYDVL
jgi:hypothetical protein